MQRYTLRVLHIVLGFGTVFPSGISFFECVMVCAADATLMHSREILLAAYAPPTPMVDPVGVGGGTSAYAYGTSGVGVAYAHNCRA